jgi:methylenetetrahydrofolate dehydrogenase (NADP+)/methenyltetrahydrofolate cyclohydrolase
MRAHIFDGKRAATEKETSLKKEIADLKKKGITPKLVSILVGRNYASKLFLSLKKKAAKRVSVKLEIKKLSASKSVSQLVKLIKDLNQNDNVHGIMVQLPLPQNFSSTDRKKVISAIAPEKDVDGMRDDSQYLAPVVKAVLMTIREASNYIVRPPLRGNPYKVVVVGAEGFVGAKIVKVLKEMPCLPAGRGYEVKGVDINTKDPVKPRQGRGNGASLKQKTKSADILISATGQVGLIKGDMIKQGAVVVDAGAPRGDVLFEDVVNKASFIIPVPGGIGPVTIACLLENLVEAAKASLQK